MSKKYAIILTAIIFYLTSLTLVGYLIQSRTERIVSSNVNKDLFIIYQSAKYQKDFSSAQTLVYLSMQDFNLAKSSRNFLHQLEVDYWDINSLKQINAYDPEIHKLLVETRRIRENPESSNVGNRTVPIQSPVSDPDVQNQ